MSESLVDDELCAALAAVAPKFVGAVKLPKGSPSPGNCGAWWTGWDECLVDVRVALRASGLTVAETGEGAS